jgi:hypothetical protein
LFQSLSVFLLISSLSFFSFYLFLQLIPLQHGGFCLLRFSMFTSFFIYYIWQSEENILTNVKSFIEATKKAKKILKVRLIWQKRLVFSVVGLVVEWEFRNSHSFDILCVARWARWFWRNPKIIRKFLSSSETTSFHIFLFENLKQHLSDLKTCSWILIPPLSLRRRTPIFFARLKKTKTYVWFLDFSRIIAPTGQHKGYQKNENRNKNVR